MEDNKKIKIQIKSVFGDVLFECEKKNNTIKDTVEEAVRQGANLRDANLEDANLRDANLEDANLEDAKNIPYIPLACPSDGAFIGWKKVQCYLIKLEIPEDAKRNSANTRKCRCNKAKVLDIINLDLQEHVEYVINGNYNKKNTLQGRRDGLSRQIRR